MAMNEIISLAPYTLKQVDDIFDYFDGKISLGVPSRFKIIEKTQFIKYLTNHFEIHNLLKFIAWSDNVAQVVYIYDYLTDWHFRQQPWNDAWLE